MKEAMPTPTLPRRLRDLATDEKMQTAAQDQLLFEGFCHLSDSMDHFDSLAKLLKAAVAQQSELPIPIADDVRAVSEVVTPGGNAQYSTWDEARLLKHKTKLRGTGKFMRQFCLQPLGLAVMAALDNAYALLKKNAMLTDHLSRLQTELVADSWTILSASDNTADLLKFKGRILKVQKEKSSVAESMDAGMRLAHEQSLKLIDDGLQKAVATVFERVDVHFDCAVGSCILEAWNMTGTAKKIKEVVLREPCNIGSETRQGQDWLGIGNVDARGLCFASVGE